MNLFDKIRIKRKIHRLCNMMRRNMTEKDVLESVWNTKKVLRCLPEERKEGLLDKLNEVLEDECKKSC